MHLSIANPIYSINFLLNFPPINVEMKLLIQVFKFLIQAYILSLLIDVLGRDGFTFPVLEDVPDNGNYMDVTEVMYQELIWGAACQMGQPWCIGNATEQFNTWKNSYIESEPDTPV